MKVLILTEGGRNIGFGHLSRCTALYQAFEEKGFAPKMIVAGDETVKDILNGVNYTIGNWAAENHEADIIIIDSYLADLNFYKKISRTTRIAVYFDDYKRLKYPKGIIINGNIYGENINYSRDGGSVLSGIVYVPLRKQFWNISKRRVRKNIKNVIVSMGGIDESNLTVNIVAYLVRNFPKFTKTVIIGRAFKNVKLIEQEADNKTKLIRNPDAEEIRKSMIDADIAVASAGQTLAELALVGVPTVGICCSENQRHNLEAWKKIGFYGCYAIKRDLNIDMEILNGIERFEPYAKREAFYNSITKKIDGKGCSRIVDVLINRYKNMSISEIQVEVRAANIRDCKDLYLWRNHPTARRWSFSTENIRYNDHKKWMQEIMKSEKIKIYILESPNNEKIGQVRFEEKSTTALISVNLNPEYYGKKLGSKVIQKATEKFFEEKLLISEVCAEMFEENVASVKAFQKAGYQFSNKSIKAGKKICIFKMAR
ncbi:MAG: bifunctional UDP-2,4-diacetamido-2,4,6-trideoxy-beta-L-altropyranose hydrolase/GNAT family N-acetyltransferase [Candidatus Omnitrophota bacterium]